MAGKKSAIYGGAQLTDQRGLGVPVPIDTEPIGLREKIGYMPERLDDLIETLIQNTEQGAGLLRKYTPALGQLMSRLAAELDVLLQAMAVTAPPSASGEVVAPAVPAGVDIALRLAGQVSIILERLNRMTMQSVKAKDDATRLRVFLATGDDEEALKGLENCSEIELRKMVQAAAAGFKEPEQL